MGKTKALNQVKDVSSGDDIRPMSPQEAVALVHPLKDWRYVPETNSIRAEFKARNFLSATHFIQIVARLAEELNHHPDVHLTGYRHLTFELTTHEAKGLTKKDFTLAARISQTFAEYTGPVQDLQNQRDAILKYQVDPPKP